MVACGRSVITRSFSIGWKGDSPTNEIWASELEFDVSDDVNVEGANFNLNCFRLFQIFNQQLL